MLRWILYWAGGLVFTILVAIIFYALLPIYRKYSDLPHVIIRFWSLVLVKLFYGTDIQLNGSEKIDALGTISKFWRFDPEPSNQQTMHPLLM